MRLEIGFDCAVCDQTGNGDVGMSEPDLQTKTSVSGN
jgi:hypothetical protein